MLNDENKTIATTRLQILFDNVNQAIFLFNFMGQILEVNKTSCELLDYSREELISLTLAEIIPSEFTSKIPEGIKETLEKSKTTFESALVRRDRKKISVEMFIKIVELKDLNAILVSAKEIEDSKNRDIQYIELEKFFLEDPNLFLRVSENVIIYCNKVSQELFNIEPGDNVPTVLVESINSSINGKLIIEYEIELNERIYLLKFTPIQDEKYVNIYGRDITENKKAEKTISYLAKFPSENPNPVLWVSKDSVLYSNKAGEDLFNVKKDSDIPAFLKHPVEDVYNKNELSEQEVEVNNRIYLLNVSSTKNQDFVSIQGIDITERKKAEKMLSDYSQRMEFLNYIITAGNNASDLNSLLSEILKSILELMAFDGGLIHLTNDNDKTAELICSKTVTTEFLEVIKIIQFEYEPFDRLFINGESLFIEDYYKFNSKFALLSKFLSFASIPIFSKEKVIGAINIGSKMNYHFTIEEKDLLKFIGREMGTIITKMQTEEALYEARNITDFYRDLVAHDISNILQNIDTSIALISLLQKKEEKIEKIIELVDVVKEQIVRGSNLVTNIRKLSKISGTGIDFEPIEVMQVMSNAVKFIQMSFPHKNISIHINSQLKKLFIQANEYLLDIFENILFNAVKYNENPSVEIEISILKYEREGKNYLRMEFMDNGIGIPDNRKKIILKTISEGKRTVKGMGIGLFTVNKIIKSFKGKIWVEDRIKGEPSKGSNFIILIPL